MDIDRVRRGRQIVVQCPPVFHIGDDGLPAGRKVEQRTADFLRPCPTELAAPSMEQQAIDP